MQGRFSRPIFLLFNKIVQNPKLERTQERYLGSGEDFQTCQHRGGGGGFLKKFDKIYTPDTPRKQILKISLLTVSKPTAYPHK